VAPKLCTILAVVASLGLTGVAAAQKAGVQVAAALRYTGNSIAVLREKTSLKRYKLRQGEQLGRLRVSQIRSKDVVFTIEDFGYTRQETLSLRKQEDVAQ
jgi:hypothetical protein